MICTKCGEAKSEDEFYRRKNVATGRMSQCKQCTEKRRVANRPEVPGWRDQYCPVCNAGPYINASHHATVAHGVHLPRSRHISDDLRENHRQHFEDQVQDGVRKRPRVKQDKCQRGHPLRGHNIVLNGQGRRGCRKCLNAAGSRWKKRQREARGNG